MSGADSLRYLRGPAIRKRRKLRPSIGFELPAIPSDEGH
jgi:hypothetical protein